MADVTQRVTVIGGGLAGSECAYQLARRGIPVTLREMTLYTGSFVMSGQTWTDPVTTATMTLEIEDVGAGAEPEAGDDG